MQQQQENKQDVIFHDPAPVDKKTGEDHKSFTYWLKKNRYYHQQIINFYRFVVPSTASVLHLNGKNGYLLDALRPMHGVGIDESAAAIRQAQAQYPTYTFYAGSIRDL